LRKALRRNKALGLARSLKASCDFFELLASRKVLDPAAACSAVKFDERAKGVPADMFRQGDSIIAPDIVKTALGQSAQSVAVVYTFLLGSIALLHVYGNKIVLGDDLAAAMKY
jgi:hypothetical protein